MCIIVFGNDHVLFWLVNVKFLGLYDLFVNDLVSDRFSLQMAKGKKFWQERPQANPAENPARTWADCLGFF